MTAAALLLLAGLLAWLFRTHLRARPYFDRPALARNRLCDPLLLALAALLTTAGIGLLWRSLPSVAVAVTAALAGAAGYLRLIRSVPFQRWLLRRDYTALRLRHPDLAERALLFRLVMSRHPRWGEELIEQMVIDYPSLDEVARLMARMDKGFRGFR